MADSKIGWYLAEVRLADNPTAIAEGLVVAEDPEVGVVVLADPDHLYVCHTDGRTRHISDDKLVGRVQRELPRIRLLLKPPKTWQHYLTESSFLKMAIAVGITAAATQSNYAVVFCVLLLIAGLSTALLAYTRDHQTEQKGAYHG